MAEQRNFLLGRGERLTEPISGGGRKLDRVPPYTFEEAKSRLVPMFEEAIKTFDALPEGACPQNETVGSLVLNPEYIAKSYYPTNFLRVFNLRTVGSRPIRITPANRSKNRTPKEANTTELFVAGHRSAFKQLATVVPQVQSDHAAAVGVDELAAIERFSALQEAQKIKSIPSGEQMVPLEVVLHASEFQSDNYILDAFEDWVNELRLEVDINRRLHAGGLCFVGLMSPKAKIPRLAQFSFLRAVRQMPKLRVFDPVIRSVPLRSSTVTLPDASVIDEGIRVAIFDGGLPETSLLKTWVKSHDAPGVGTAVPELLQHGQAVTSAALFGHLTPGESAEAPYTRIDHYRVLDDKSGLDPLNLVDVLDRIRTVLETSPTYDFINLSIGPQLAIDDDDVHAWTAVLDEYLEEGKTLATVAVGNDGLLDAGARLNRIQVPSDCVNGVSVGACDRIGDRWTRAPYSSVGPGRSPGLVKPDVVSFGGSQVEPYLVLDHSGSLGLLQTAGTSFAAPHTMRLAAGIKAHFGSLLSPLAIRALMVHTADSLNHPQAEVGWGRVSEDINEIVVCPDGVVRVVYQGELSASKYLRARLPMPTQALSGNVQITATCCFATAIDSAHPSNYTRSGVEVVFRPHDEKFEDEDSIHPISDTFMSKRRLYQTEDELRNDAHKWETCLHAKIKKRGTSLKNPMLDLHYLAREEGHNDRRANRIQYALILTVEAPRHKDLYDQVVRAYSRQLEAMRPVVEIQVQTKP